MADPQNLRLDYPEQDEFVSLNAEMCTRNLSFDHLTCHVTKNLKSDANRGYGSKFAFLMEV